MGPISRVTLTIHDHADSGSWHCNFIRIERAKAGRVVFFICNEWMGGLACASKTLVGTIQDPREENKHYEASISRFRGWWTLPLYLRTFVAVDPYEVKTVLNLTLIGRLQSPENSIQRATHNVHQRSSVLKFHCDNECLVVASCFVCRRLQRLHTNVVRSLRHARTMSLPSW